MKSFFEKGIPLIHYRSSPKGFLARKKGKERLFRDLQDAINYLHNPGGKIFGYEGTYTYDETLLFPYLSKSIHIEGACGWGKTYQESGTHIVSEIENDALFKIDAQDDIRSAYGLKFSDLKLVGPYTDDSVGLDMRNVDVVEVTGCLLGKFGTPIQVIYQGESYDPPELPGKLWLHDCEIAESKIRHVYFEKVAQSEIHDNMFESGGPFLRHIQLRDSNKIRIFGNEFNVSDPTSALQECILIEVDRGKTVSDWGTYHIQIHDNRFYKTAVAQRFIRVLGICEVPPPNGFIAHQWITSRNNLIDLNYQPSLTEDSLYEVPDDLSTRDALSTMDYSFFSRPSEKLIDVTDIFPVNLIHQNKWTPMTLYIWGDMLINAGEDPIDWESRIAIELGARPLDDWMCHIGEFDIFSACTDWDAYETLLGAKELAVDVNPLSVDHIEQDAHPHGHTSIEHKHDLSPASHSHPHPITKEEGKAYTYAKYLYQKRLFTLSIHVPSLYCFRIKTFGQAGLKYLVAVYE